MPARFARAVLIGGLNVDRASITQAARPRLAASNPGRTRTGFGGAARNVAEAMARLGAAASLVSRVGDDADGHAALAAARMAGIDVGLVAIDPAQATSTYVAVFGGDGELVIGVSAMAAIEAIGAAEVVGALAAMPDALAVIDANLSPAAIEAAFAARPPFLAALAVSADKAARLLGDDGRVRPFDALFLNRFEAAALAGGDAADLGALCRALGGRGLVRGVLTGGPAGALAFEGERQRLLPALAADVVNVNGAGDVLAGATLARFMAGAGWIDAAAFGVAAAAIAVEAEASVPAGLTIAAVERRRAEDLP